MIPFLTTNGLPLSAGQLYTYAAGTTTPQVTYTSNSGSVANTNPIVLGTNGIAPNPIWLTDNVSYKFVLQDASGNVLETYDNINGQGTISGNLTVGGTVTANAITCTNNETIGGNLTVSGSITGGSFSGVTGRIVQTVHSNGTYATTTSGSPVASGHSATITPTSTSSKILVLYTGGLAQGNITSNANAWIALYRNGSNLIGSNAWCEQAVSNQNIYGTVAISYLDAPTTTSATTYATYFWADGGGSAIYSVMGTAQITLLEIL
jgi:hypothetical protein